MAMFNSYVKLPEGKASNVGVPPFLGHCQTVRQLPPSLGCEYSASNEAKMPRTFTLMALRPCLRRQDWRIFDVDHRRNLENDMENNNNQWEFQDPKMEVLYHIRPYFAGIFPYIGPRPYIALTYGKYLQFRFLKWPLK